ncbi:ACT domain-containing protein, partial [Pseudomonas baetica]
MQTEQLDYRLLNVEWENAGTQSKQYHVDLEISGYDRRGLLNDVLQTVNEMRTNIIAVNGRSDRNKMAVVNLT